jgi:hypothetical protein
MDELFTLLKLRESHRIAVAAIAALLDQSVTRVEKVGEADFGAARKAFEQFGDKEWSFTDCTSKVIMERLGITHAFAFDRHFEEFGTVIRVPERAGF